MEEKILEKVTAFKMFHVFFMVLLLYFIVKGQIQGVVYVLAIQIILLQNVQFRVIDQLNKERINEYKH